MFTYFCWEEIIAHLDVYRDKLEEKMTEITCFEFLPIRETQKQTRANKNQAPGELD